MVMMINGYGVRSRITMGVMASKGVTRHWWICIRYSFRNPRVIIPSVEPRLRCCSSRQRRAICSCLFPWWLDRSLVDIERLWKDLPISNSINTAI